MLTLDDVIAIDRRIDAREVLECACYGLDDRRHISERVAFSLLEVVLFSFSPSYQVGDIRLEEAGHVGSYLHGLHHTIGDDATDRIHRDHTVFRPDGDGWCSDLRTSSGYRGCRGGTFGAWRRRWCALLLLDVADDVGLADTTTKACALDAV